ncbi:MAG: peptide chain release factor 1 [Deltaproteobacteria bacterium]|nr:peptide chain release factor 1 [Deltaproteobacteria bacterium]
MSLFDKLAEVEARYDAMGEELSQPDVAADQNRFKQLMREYSHLREIVEIYREWRDFNTELADARELLADDDDDLREMAREELSRLEPQVEGWERKLKVLLLPKDPNEGRNVILEIRAGVGGDEAGLFAADLFRMYSRYGDSRRWKFELLNLSANEAGGYKEVICSIAGDDVYARLKYESGVHRVQRVPATEAQGRIHTSTCTVALMPEAEEVDIQIEEKDLRVDVFRASGPGGQSVNTTDSAVRLTHLPTNMVVTCQDEKSQHKNKAKALKVLRTRLYEKEQEAQRAEQRDMRLSQVGTGDRSERIRTYNFPQGRLTDHRIGLTLYSLERLMEGELDEVLSACTAHFEAEALKAVDEE